MYILQNKMQIKVILLYQLEIEVRSGYCEAKVDKECVNYLVNSTCLI